MSLSQALNQFAQNLGRYHWGSVDSAIAWLKLIYDYCREHPDYIVRERS